MSTTTKTERVRGGVKLYGVQRFVNGSWQWICHTAVFDQVVMCAAGAKPRALWDDYASADAFADTVRGILNVPQLRIWRWQGRTVEASA